LIIEVATKLGVAFYGDNGDEEAQVPRDVHDLSECRKHVNNAIRMFLADAPAGGWRCQHPIASVVLWPSVAVDATVTATGIYDPPTQTTLITASEDTFYPSMELKTIVVTGGESLTIATYVSATQVRVAGDHNWSTAATFSITADGNYTLPQTFGGQYNGDITYAADTAIASSISWTNEAQIRRMREDTTGDLGDPYLAAVRPIAGNQRRWELLSEPIPQTMRVVEFLYELHFDSLVDLTDMHPCGFVHDEAIRAACMAVAERDAEDVMAGLMQYYRQVALPNSFRIDGRQAPRRLGSMNRRATINQHNFRDHQRRPEVTMTP